MKGVVVTTKDVVSIQDFSNPLYESLGKAVGGWFELVRPAGLPEPYRMIVNEEGLLLDLPLNALGCLLYGTLKHGYPIVGDLVVMKEGYTEDGPDLIGLEDDEAEYLAKSFKDLFVARAEA